MSQQATHDPLRQRGAAAIRLQDYRCALYRPGDMESVRLFEALHRKPGPITRLCLTALEGPAPIGKLAQRLRPAPRFCRKRCDELLEAASEFMGEDLVTFAATFDTAVDWAILAVKTREGVFFITARPKGHPAIPSQADFLRDLEPVCPDRLRIPHVVRTGDAGGWSMLALTDLDPPAQKHEPAIDQLVSHLCALRDTGSREVDCAELANEIDALSGLTEPLRRVLLEVNEAPGSVLLCRAHGDFVPWNLVTDGDVLYAWDWTHAMREAPWPFDAVHYCFQVRRHDRHEDREAALAGTLQDVSAIAPLLGLEEDLGVARRALALYVAFRHANELRLGLLGSDTDWLAERAV